MDLGEPDSVNELGTKWWLDKSTTEWATRENLSGIRLLGYKCYIVQAKDGHMTRMLFDEKNSCVYENTNLEAVAVRIDIIKTDKLFSSQGA